MECRLLFPYCLQDWCGISALEFGRTAFLRKVCEHGLTTPSSETAECGAAPAWWAERRRRKQVPSRTERFAAAHG